ncbi:hypothetical protein VCHA29O37_140055 [Vibrio chagasii]|nr:hypothetical protein VCHA29O37_140055 [Vibrio chagasii]
MFTEISSGILNADYSPWLYMPQVRIVFILTWIKNERLSG